MDFVFVAHARGPSRHGGPAAYLSVNKREFCSQETNGGVPRGSAPNRADRAAENFNSTTARQ